MITVTFPVAFPGTTISITVLFPVPLISRSIPSASIEVFEVVKFLSPLYTATTE